MAKSPKQSKFILLILFIIALSLLATATIYIENSEGTFTGTFTNTFYNSTAGGVQMNLSVGETTLLTDNTSGLVAYYKFNEDGEAIDSSGNNYNVDESSAWSVDGKIGKSQRASNLGYIENITNFPALRFTNHNQMSFSFWEKLSTLPSDSDFAIFFSDGANAGNPTAIGKYVVYFDKNNDDMNFGLFGTPCVTTGVTWSAYEWHHIAGTYNGTHMQIYFDGVLENTCAKTGNISSGEFDFRMADFNAPNTLTLDELTIWNRTLTATEISNIYSSQDSVNYTYSQTIDTGGSTINNLTYSTPTVDTTSQQMYMSFDTDVSNSFDGINITNNGVTIVSGKKYNAGDFEIGESDYINTSFTTDGLTELTISFWVNFESNNANDYIFDNSNGGGCIIRGDGSKIETVCFVDGSPIVTDSNVLTDGEWNHIVVVHNATGTSIYENGAFISTNSEGGAIQSSSGTLVNIGAEYDGTDSFDGQLDEFRIWTRALTGTEITNLYNLDNKIKLVNITYELNSNSTIYECTTSPCDISTTAQNITFKPIFDYDTWGTSSILYNWSLNYAGTPDSTTPLVTIINNSFSTDSLTPQIWFNVTDNSATLDCDLLVNGTVNATNATTANNTNTMLQATGLTYATNYTMNISCTDGTNTNQTESIWVYVNAEPPVYTSNITNLAIDYLKTTENPNVNFYLNYSFDCSNHDTNCFNVWRNITVSDSNCQLQEGLMNMSYGNLTAGSSISNYTIWKCIGVGEYTFNITAYSNNTNNILSVSQNISIENVGLTTEQAEQLQAIYEEVQNMGLAIIIGIMLTLGIVLLVVQSMRTQNEFGKYLYILGAMLLFVFGLNVAVHIADAGTVTGASSVIKTLYNVSLTAFWFMFLLIVWIGIVNLKVRKVKRPVFKSPMEIAKERRKQEKRGY